MKKFSFKKIFTALLIATIFISTTPSTYLTVMAAESNSTTNDPSNSNCIEIIEKNDTATTMYSKYYMTYNGETFLYIEYGEIQDDVVVVDTTSVKLDTNR